MFVPQMQFANQFIWSNVGAVVQVDRFPNVSEGDTQQTVGLLGELLDAVASLQQAIESAHEEGQRALA
jgi:hypothetical protein